MKMFEFFPILKSAESNKTYSEVQEIKRLRTIYGKIVDTDEDLLLIDSLVEATYKR